MTLVLPDYGFLTKVVMIRMSYAKIIVNTMAQRVPSMRKWMKSSPLITEKEAYQEIP